MAKVRGKRGGHRQPLGAAAFPNPHHSFCSYAAQVHKTWLVSYFIIMCRKRGKYCIIGMYPFAGVLMVDVDCDSFGSVVERLAESLSRAYKLNEAEVTSLLNTIQNKLLLVVFDY